MLNPLLLVEADAEVVHQSEKNSKRAVAATTLGG